MDGEYIIFIVKNAEQSQKLVDYYYTWDCKKEAQMEEWDIKPFIEEAATVTVTVSKYDVEPDNRLLVRNFCKIFGVQLEEELETMTFTGPRALVEEILLFIKKKRLGE